MQVLYSRCCGIDVHKDSITACVLIYSDTAEPQIRKRSFATSKKSLGHLRLWLFAQKVTPVAMESTGVSWKPVLTHRAARSQLWLLGAVAVLTHRAARSQLWLLGAVAVLTHRAARSQLWLLGAVAVWQALEGNFDLTWAHPYQIKTIPGRKTDARDSQ